MGCSFFTTEPTSTNRAQVELETNFHFLMTGKAFASKMTMISVDIWLDLAYAIYAVAKNPLYRFTGSSKPAIFRHASKNELRRREFERTLRGRM